MSNSQSVPPFVFDSLYYLNRDQLERFSIVCRSLKNIIERYFNSKPYRIFDRLVIRGGSYALIHNRVQWHPNRDDYNVQQFLDGQKCDNVLETVLERNCICNVLETGKYYPFTEMIPYFGSNVRVKIMTILVSASAYNPDNIEEIESITYLWQNGNISVWNFAGCGARIGAEDFLLILNSPTILQCRDLEMVNADFSFKNHKVLYAVKVIEITYISRDIDPNHWLDFFKHPVVKPVIAFHSSSREFLDTILDRFSKDFSSATAPMAFRIVLSQQECLLRDRPFAEFRETNKTSGEKLELKKGMPIEYQHCPVNNHIHYTLERSGI